MTITEVFTGSFKDSKLVWSYEDYSGNGIDHSKPYSVIAAEYDATGRLLRTVYMPISAAGDASQSDVPTGLTATAGHTYKLFMVQEGTGKPLCAAWCETVS